MFGGRIEPFLGEMDDKYSLVCKVLKCFGGNGVECRLPINPQLLQDICGDQICNEALSKYEENTPSSQNRSPMTYPNFDNYVSQSDSNQGEECSDLDSEIAFSDFYSDSSSEDDLRYKLVFPDHYYYSSSSSESEYKLVFPERRSDNESQTKALNPGNEKLGDSGIDISGSKTELEWKNVFLTQ